MPEKRRKFDAAGVALGELATGEAGGLMVGIAGVAFAAGASTGANTRCSPRSTTVRSSYCVPERVPRHVRFAQLTSFHELGSHGVISRQLHNPPLAHEVAL
jgi:hypothetical protein